MNSRARFSLAAFAVLLCAVEPAQHGRVGEHGEGQGAEVAEA